MALSMRPASRMPVSKKGKKKSDEAQNVLDRLEAFLDEKVPGLVKQLASFWALQAAAVTHKQLRSFVAEEDSPDSLIPDWRHDYAVLAAGKLADGWREALTAGMRAVTPGSGSAQGHEDIDTRQGTDARSAGPAESGTLFPDLLTPVGQATSQPHVTTGGAGTLLTPTPIPPSGGSTVIYSPTDEKIRNWINTRAGELITNSTNEQVEAIRHILMESKANQMSVEETARLIRPTIGLTRPQAASNLKYYNSVKESLRKEHPRMKEESIEKKAREAAEKYAQKQIRYRAQLIAETELAFAYNYGHHEAIREGMASGKLPLMREIWSTANNGHVCESCQDLEGVEVGFDEEFSVDVHSKRNPERVLRTLTAVVPPLHPRCHCALMYVEAKIENGTVNLENENASYEGIPKTWVTIDSEEDINDISKVNPTKDKANCVNCVIAYEMRQQGKAVYAGPQIKKLQHYPILGWIDPDVRNIQPGENASEILKNYLTEAGEGARIQINILWNKKTSGAWDSKSEITGHSFVGTLKNNKYHYIDVQTDSEYNENIFELCNQKPITYWRINGLTPSDLGASACRKE